MRKQLNWKRKHRRGQAIIEFALVAPILLALMFGIIELALIGASLSICENAAQNAIHLLAVNGDTNPTIDTQVVQMILGRANILPLIQIQSIIIYQSSATNSGPQISSENIYSGASGIPTTQNWPVSQRFSTVSTPVFAGIEIQFAFNSPVASIGSWSVIHLQAQAVSFILPSGG